MVVRTMLGRHIGALVRGVAGRLRVVVEWQASDMILFMGSRCELGKKNGGRCARHVLSLIYVLWY